MHSGAGSRFEPLTAAWRDIDGCSVVFPVAYILILFQPKTHAPLILKAGDQYNLSTREKVVSPSGASGFNAR